MNFPIQTAPVLRGHDRGKQAMPPPAADPTAGQSQVAGPKSAFCAACALAPPPWSLVCSIFCPLIFH
jgi:hypothetical protein